MLDLTKNWKRVIDSLYKGIVVIDTDGSIRHVNPALERLTGFRANELMGNACTMLGCSGCEPWYGKDFWCVLFCSGQAMKPMSCRINSKSGHRLKVIKQASILRDAKGVAVGAVETIWDMGDLKRPISGNCCSEKKRQNKTNGQGKKIQGKTLSAPHCTRALIKAHMGRPTTLV